MLDKHFLITYTDIYSDGERHAGCAWFKSEEELRRFLQIKEQNAAFETDFAIEIWKYRQIEL